MICGYNVRIQRLSTSFQVHWWCMTATPDFAPFAAKMRDAGLSQTFIDNFHHYYGQLVHGATGYIPRDAAQPVDDLPTYAGLDGAMQRVGCLLYTSRCV